MSHVSLNFYFFKSWFQFAWMCVKALRAFRNLGDIDGETAAQTLIAQVRISKQQPQTSNSEFFFFKALIDL